MPSPRTIHDVLRRHGPAVCGGEPRTGKGRCSPTTVPSEVAQPSWADLDADSWGSIPAWFVQARRPGGGHTGRAAVHQRHQAPRRTTGPGRSSLLGARAFPDRGERQHRHNLGRIDWSRPDTVSTGLTGSTPPPPGHDRHPRRGGHAAGPWRLRRSAPTPEHVHPAALPGRSGLDRRSACGGALEGDAMGSLSMTTFTLGGQGGQATVEAELRHSRMFVADETNM